MITTALLMIVMSKSSAVICAGAVCAPALYGYATPEGRYTIRHMYSSRLKMPVMVFHVDRGVAFAIHVTYGNPEQQRAQRLLSATPADNRITNGCINVSVDTWKYLSRLPDGTAITIT